MGGMLSEVTVVKAEASLGKQNVRQTNQDRFSKVRSRRIYPKVTTVKTLGENTLRDDKSA